VSFLNSNYVDLVKKIS